MKRLFFLSAVALFGFAQCFAVSPRGFMAKRAVGGMKVESRAKSVTNEYGRLVTIVAEDFSKFTEGSEDSPVDQPLETDWGGSFDGDKVNTHGWGGNNKVHEAGGSAFVEKDGLLWTPDLNMADAIDYRVIVSFRARVAMAATEGTVSVSRGYGSAETDKLTSSWQDYEISFSGEFTGTYLTFSADADWLIDDIVVSKVMPFVEAPTMVGFSEYTKTSFMALWSPAEGASSYLLDVYSYDGEGSKVPALSEEPVADTHYHVTGLQEIDGFYYFTVIGVDDAGHRSEASEEVCVEGLPAPVALEPTDVSKDGFTANWSPVDGAIGYDFWAYNERTAAVDSEMALVDTDFGFVSASDQSQNDVVSYDAFPGWIINVPKFADGAIGLDGLRAVETEYYASMESPEYDLSHGDGNVELSISAKASSGTTLSFSLFTKKDGSFSVYPDSYYKISDLPADEYDKRTVRLSGGGEQSVIFISASDWGEAWIDDMRITQTFKTGETMVTPVFERITEQTSATVSGVDMVSGGKFYFTVMAFKLNHLETDFAVSDYSDKKYVVYSQSGIADMVVDKPKIVVTDGLLTVMNPNGEAVTVSDLSGRVIEARSDGADVALRLYSPGIYLVRVGNTVSKVMVR